jgi:uncharacterized membrane protein YdjX (TVP38/TMEM64 family)
VLLLLADVLLPVPSSLVMLANGAVFGVGAGALLSIVGTVGATVLGVMVGRGGRGVAARFMTNDDYVRSRKLLDRWGVFALIITRPVPVLAETTAITCGLGQFSLTSAALAGAVGAIPASVVYALAGSAVVGALDFSLIFLCVIGLGGIAFAIETWRRKRAASASPTHLAR